MTVLGTHSKAFLNKGLNNYDNQVLKNQKQIYQKLNIKVKDSDKVKNTVSKHSDKLKNQVNNLLNSESQQLKSKIDYKNHITQKLNQWSFFDSNINNNLVEQRKLIDRKNYELDSRAFALKNYGYSPFFKQDQDKMRGVQNIVLGNKVVGTAHENLSPYRLHYTPITKYQKQLIDAKIKP